ncbi:MAG: RDD family protein [Kofleriaceae bacterium]
MVDREPAALGMPAGVAPPRLATDRLAGAATGRAAAQTVYVHGFWRRAAAAAVDLGIILPTALVVCWVAGKLSGVSLPAMKIGPFDLDLWIDLVLALDPGLIMDLVLTLAIGLTYLTVFHVLRGRTLGMTALKMKIIDVYGDRPSPRRAVLRVAGYLAGVATLGLGFLWIGFDSEKRGLHDWIAGTYVVKA